MKHVVIIGGGFGGLAAARALRKANVRITLLDRRNHHVFQPLLYQVATAALNPADIAYPIRGALRKQSNVRVLLADVRTIEPDNHKIILDDGELEYDFVIVATGATHSYFGKPWEPLAPGLKSVEDALEIRRRVLVAYEAAERESDPALQKEWLTFVVVGAGPTGVELAGALREIGVQTLAHDFRGIDPTSVRVILVEGKDRLLPTFAPKLSEAARKTLTKRKVDVRISAMVTDMDERGVTVSLGGATERIAARTVLWAAGVQASPLARSLGVPLDRAGRVIVEPDLSIPGHPDVFVIGDLAKMISDGTEVPGMAQGAIQSGRHAAAIIKGAARAPFRYRDKGSMAAIGRSQAVVQIKGVERAGFFAWLMWWVVHIALLISFRNRFAVMWQWIWSYATFQRGSRLITGPLPQLPKVTGIAHDGAPALPPPAEPVVLPQND
ncbi:MAG TPA: NAD(P)/FAD-dependent oxidoreductase [Kofleriaceae bacterium]|nr:NAD(P)/FAD-dependent oxidoreductase [Kofleriaceae bacterium]